MKNGQWIPFVISILMLGWALSPSNPYAYYMFLRFVICGVSAYAAYLYYQKRNEGMIWILGGQAVLYNPFLRVHLDRDFWTIINIASMLLFAKVVWDMKRGT